MFTFPSLSSLRATFLTLVLSGLGAALATALAIPAPVLIGPALTVSMAALCGVRLEILAPLRNGAFIILGIGIGSAFDTQAGAAILRWPLAMAALGLSLWISMFLCQWILRHRFGFANRSAVLAAAPGHLSFVMSLAISDGMDTARIGVVQSIRLLALTLIVPVAALIMGFPFAVVAALGGAPMSLLQLAVLGALGAALGVGFGWLRLPAPLLLGGMAVSGVSHVTGVLPGSVPTVLLLPAFLVLGGLIGSRFSGISWSAFRSALGAGLAVTVIASMIAAITAVPVAMFLGMPLVNVLAAFAPGGVETMIALGAALGFDPSFVAACHIMRLVFLTFMIPLAYGRT